MKKHCTKACGHCPKGLEMDLERRRKKKTRRSAKKKRRSGKKKKRPCPNAVGDKKCNDWKANGKCGGPHESWMKKHCTKACGHCPKGLEMDLERRRKKKTRRSAKKKRRSCPNAVGDKKCNDWKAKGKCGGLH